MPTPICENPLFQTDGKGVACVYFCHEVIAYADAESFEPLLIGLTSGYGNTLVARR